MHRVFLKLKRVRSCAACRNSGSGMASDVKTAKSSV